MQSIKGELKYALDPISWCEEALSFNPDSWQRDILVATEKYIILNIHRQAGKTTIAALMALHRFLFYSDSLILLLSKTEDQSKEIMLKVMHFYEKLDPVHKELVEDQVLAIMHKNESRIIVEPGGNPDGIRGYSAPDLIIEDEASRVPEELYIALRPMLAVSQGRMILMSTPNLKFGHFYEIWSKGDGWLKRKITANQCPRISKEFLENERLNLLPEKYRREYECEFSEGEGAVFSSDLFKSLMNPAVESFKVDI